MSLEIVKSRLKLAAASLDAKGVDVLLLTPGADLLYLTGFQHGHAGERLLALALKRDGSSAWIVPSMNVAQVRERALPDQPVHAWADGQGYLPALRREVHHSQRVAFDDEARSAFLLDLIAVAPGAEIVTASSIMRELRMRKTADELDSLRRAASTVDGAITDAFALCTPGSSETEIDQALRRLLLSRSPASSVAFTIVGTGPNSALPHHETSDRRLQAGEILLLDFGTREPGGYNSDITVVCSAGEPADPEVRKVYAIVHAAQQAALAAARPGVTCESIDRAARDVIREAGYGEFFVHRTGHGLGLQLHEPPYMVAGNIDPLCEGMVFSIEPGIYLPERFGLRLEVIATITSDGAQLLNAPSAPELPVIV